MNAESILRLLDNPDTVQEISEDSLKQLQDKFPYSQNIQFLNHKKLGKREREGHSSSSLLSLFISPAKLAFAQTKSNLKEPSNRNDVMAIDLEIKQIIDQVKEIEDVIDNTNNEFVVENAPIINPKIKASPQKLDAPIDKLQYIDVQSPLKLEKEKIVERKIRKKKSKKINKKNKEQVKKIKVPKEEIQHYKKVKKKKKTPIKLEKSKVNNTSKKSLKIDKPHQERSFVEWLDSLEDINTMLTEKKRKKDQKESKKKKKHAAKTSTKSLLKKPISKKKRKKKKRLQEKIDASIHRKDGAISSTLASIMAKQGHKKEAIKIYKQLKLNNPEKSSYFASQIKKLK